MVDETTVHYRRETCTPGTTCAMGPHKWDDPVSGAICFPSEAVLDHYQYVVVHKDGWPFDVLVDRASAIRQPDLSCHQIALQYFAALEAFLGLVTV